MPCLLPMSRSDPGRKAMIDMRGSLAPRCLFLYNTVAYTGTDTARAAEIQHRLEDRQD